MARVLLGGARPSDLNAAFAANPQPPRLVYGNTIFDYSLRFVWDLKAHTEAWRYPVSGTTKRGQASAPLNDQEAIRECVAEQGLGFLVVGGVAVADEDGSFVEWHRKFKIAHGVKKMAANSDKSRVRKSAFEPRHVEAFYFHNSLEWTRLKRLDTSPASSRVSSLRAPRVGLGSGGVPSTSSTCRKPGRVV